MTEAQTPGQAACGCPESDGKIYHQRGTCTDPVVAKLDWYADAGRIAAAQTPGQAALEARNRDLEEWHKRDALAIEAHRTRADHQEQRARDAEEKLTRFADQAAQYQELAERAAEGQRDADLVTELRRRIEAMERHRARALAAQEQPAPEVRIADCPEHGDVWHVQVNAGGRWLCGVSLMAVLREYEPQPAESQPAPASASQVRRHAEQAAPGLRAAMAALAEYERLAEAGTVPNSATRADIRKRAGLEAP